MDNVPTASTDMKVLTCSVYLCPSSSTQSSVPQFYSFPKELERCSVWVRRCTKTEVSEIFRKYGTRRLHSRNRICSEHFQEGDFRNPEDKSQGLKSDAVPSRNFQTRLSESQSNSDCSTGTCSSESDAEQSDSPMCIDGRIAPHDASSDTSDDIAVKEDGTPNEEGYMLRKRLLDNERKNCRLKRAIERLKRQNVTYRKKLT